MKMLTTREKNNLREKRLIKRAMIKLDRYIAAREAGIYIDEHSTEHRQSVRLMNAITEQSAKERVEV